MRLLRIAYRMFTLVIMGRIFRFSLHENEPIAYLDVHFMFVLPWLITLVIVSRPFIKPVDKLALKFLCTVAVLWTTPW